MFSELIISIQYNMKHFYEITTCHGLADLNRAPCYKRRLLWMLIIIATFTLLCFFVFIVIRDYTTAPLVTSISMVNSVSMELPEVSVCYSLAINPNKADAVGLPKSITKGLIKHFQVVSRVGLGMKNETNLRNELDTFLTRTIYHNRFDKLMQDISFSCQDLLYCAFQGIQKFGSNSTDLCSTLRYIAHPQMGYCFIIPKLTQVWPGSSAGWKLLLGTPSVSEEYQDLQYWNGFSVAFDNPIVAPMFNDLLIPINRHTSVLLEATYEKKVEYLTWPRSSQRMCDYNRREGDSACFLRCWATALVSDCGCADFGFADLLNNASTCNPFGPVCAGSGFLACQQRCLPTCGSWSYKSTVTFSELNRAAMLKDFAPGRESKDIASISIAFSNMKYSAVTQQEAFTLQMTISNVGGQLGLWMGISVITILQALYYVVGLALAKLETQSKVEAWKPTLKEHSPNY